MPPAALLRRPLHLAALLLLLLATALDLGALLSPVWVTSERLRLSLWETCQRLQWSWVCAGTLGEGRDWQLATLVLILSGSAITLVTFVFSLHSFCRGTHQRCFRSIAVILFTAVILQICALILYPIKFIDGSMLRTYHEFGWGYGLGWGGTIFTLGGAILYCLRSDLYEEVYY